MLILPVTVYAYWNSLRRLALEDVIVCTFQRCLPLWLGKVLLGTAVEMERRLPFTFIGEIKAFVSVLYAFTACDYSTCRNRQ